MIQYTPPGLYDVSVPLLRAIHAMFLRHDRQRIPVICYRPSLLVRTEQGEPCLSVLPVLEFGRFNPDDVPLGFRRWFLDAPFAIAIPEALWRACPQRLLDFGLNGREIVLKDNWDGPGIAPPKIG